MLSSLACQATASSRREDFSWWSCRNCSARQAAKNVLLIFRDGREIGQEFLLLFAAAWHSTESTKRLLLRLG